MSRFGKLRGTLLHLMLVIGVVITPWIPVRSWVFAQGNSVPLWIVRSLHTSEYGVNDPKGLAFSSTANTFLVLNGTSNIALITLGEDNAGSRNLPEVQDDPLNSAFDKKSGSLFAFNRGKSELVKIKADGKGLPDASALPTRFAVKAFGVKDPQGIAFDPDTGRLFILDAGNSQIVSVVPHPTLGFDANEAIRSNKVQRISLKELGTGLLSGLAYNPSNDHLYVVEPAQKKLYELTQDGNVVSTFDLASLGINNPSAMTFAPNGDTTDDPNTMDLYLLDSGQSTTQSTASSSGQIVELSLLAPATLPPGTTLLPSTLVRTFDTSNAAWSPSSPDPSGIDYWPLTGNFLISDSEVDEMPNYFVGKNVFQSTTSGTLVSTCTTTAFSNEPSGLATNSDNNHIFFSDDDGSNDKITEVSLGADGVYCTSDDTFSITNAATSYGANDTEDVAYGNNTLFIADGVNAEVYSIPLGPNGVLGGGDDGAVTHFDTASLGFHDLEGIGYNSGSGTLFIVSTQGTENYLGETTTSGTLVNAYNLSFMGTSGNLRSGVTYAPSSQNPAIKSIYIVSRGVDNNSNANENDGKIWEINIGIPWVASIVRAGANPSNAASVNFTVTFSESVTGLDTNDFTLMSAGVSGAAISGVSGSGTTYTVTVNTGSGDGTIRLDLTDDDSITDAVGLRLGGIGAGNGNFTIGEVYTIDKPSSAPAAATLVSPNGAIADTTPDYLWNKVNDSTWYYLWVSKVNGDGSLTTVHTKWYDSSLVCSGATCTITPVGVTLTSGNYRWWIQTYNDADYGPWSTPMNFSLPVFPAPGAATLTSPNGAITDTTPAYIWSKVNASTWYYLWVSKVNGDGSLTTVHTKWYDSTAVCSGATCTITPVGVTLTSGDYRWWIQTYNDDGGYGAWSSAMNFSLPVIVPPGVATLVSPNGSLSDTTPTYTWNKVNASTWYYLWVSRVNGDGSLTTIHTKWYDGALVCGGITCTITPAGVTLTSGNYRWWIQTWNDGGYGPWSTKLDFSLP